LATSSSPKRSKAVETAVRPEDRLLNRELSWLDFNERVLDLVADPALPLLERVKFCAIFASNLDEFFMVRVAGLMGQAATGLAVRSPDGRLPPVVLAEIRERVLRMTQLQSRLWLGELEPALAAEGIVVGHVEDCSDTELEELKSRFDSEIYPVLTPLAVGPGQPFPYISGLSLSLGVFVRDPENGEERFARVKVPELLPRFIAVGTRGLHVPLETVIAHFLPWLFPGMEIAERAFFRVTRDADFEVSDEADDLLEAVEVELARRRFGHVVRVEVSSSVSSAMLERLSEGLAVSASQIYPIRGLLDLADLMQLASLERPELKDEPWLGVTQPRLDGLSARELFSEIRKDDFLVQLPYDSFTTSVESFVRAAVADADVIGIKATVYRTSDDSPTIPALIECAEQGKQSVCLVELKARFDEHRNIEWSREMEQRGVHVVYGFPNLKIHAKTTLIVRREGEALRRYVHVGTGNYHARTARLYEDLGLFTADEGVAADIADLFNFLTGFGRPQRFRKILVAPFTLRSRLIEEIRKVVEAAAAGKSARIRIKVNALIDEAIIEELYRASQKGVPIEIVCRGVCSLRPGVKGMSETIRVRSILGRFLEHSRFFIFESDGESSFFLGSADLMPRNLDHRIEVVAPVEDSRARQELTAIFDTLLADNTQAWELRPDGGWERLRPKKSERAQVGQAVLMRRARLRARRRAQPRSRPR
jgi:polyphosphate kinase